MRGVIQLALAFAMLFACAVADNFYETLGVSSDADEGVIKKAYRKLSLKYHPGACASLFAWRHWIGRDVWLLLVWRVLTITQHAAANMICFPLPPPLYLPLSSLSLSLPRQEPRRRVREG